MEDLRSQNASLLEEAAEFAVLVQALQVRVAANVLLVDVDVGHGALAVDLLESILEVAAFGYIERVAKVRHDAMFTRSLRDKIWEQMD
jgi:hypothetical protein